MDDIYELPFLSVNGAEFISVISNSDCNFIQSIHYLGSLIYEPLELDDDRFCREHDADSFMVNFRNYSSPQSVYSFFY